MEKTKRAEALIGAYKQIEKWCNENLQGSSYEVFVLQKNWDPHIWHDFVWNARHKELFLARGDHGRWGANDWSFKTGMSTDNFEYYMFRYDGGSKEDCTRIRPDGNLVWDEELEKLVNSWPSIKARLLAELKKEDELANFKA